MHMQIILPELAEMRLAVYDENGKLIGQRFLSMEQLRPGYRHLALRSEANSPLPLATLFVKFDLKTYIPESLANFVDALSGDLEHISVISFCVSNRICMCAQIRARS